MTEFSFPHADQSPDVNDGRPITDAEWRQAFRAIFLADTPATRFLFPAAGNALAVTNPAGVTIRVNTGAACVDGYLYVNDASVDLTAVAPGAGSRRDRVTLKAEYGTNFRVRLTIKQGTSGTVPALTQTRGDTWEVSLAYYDINAAGTVSGLTSEVTEAAYAKFSTLVTSTMLAEGILSADATGRALMATGLFDAATVAAKFGTDSLTNANLLQLVQDGAFVADANTRALFADGFINAAKIADRTRILHVPCTEAWNLNPEEIDRTNAHPYGMPMVDGSSVQCFGSFYVPSDYVSGGVVIPVVYAGGTGNLYGSQTLYYGASGETPGNEATTATTEAVINTQLKNCTNIQTAFGSIAAGDHVMIVFQRSGAHASDTVGATCQFVGWLVSYTSDS